MMIRLTLVFALLLVTPALAQRIVLPPPPAPPRDIQQARIGAPTVPVPTPYVTLPTPKITGTTMEERAKSFAADRLWWDAFRATVRKTAAKHLGTPTK